MSKEGCGWKVVWKTWRQTVARHTLETEEVWALYRKPEGVGEKRLDRQARPFPAGRRSGDLADRAVGDSPSGESPTCKWERETCSDVPLFKGFSGGDE